MLTYIRPLHQQQKGVRPVARINQHTAKPVWSDTAASLLPHHCRITTASSPLPHLEPLLTGLLYSHSDLTLK